MFARIKTIKQNGKIYEYLVISESYRKNGKSTTRDIANLGNVKKFGTRDIKSIISGIAKLYDMKKYELSDEVVILDSLEYGSIILWRKLWKQMGISKIINKLHKKKYPKVEMDLAKYIEMMVVNRCIDPSSKLGIIRWLETTCYKEMEGYSALPMNANYFYRSMDYLLEMKSEIEKTLFNKLKQLFSINVKLTFYDITSTFVYGENCSIAEYGYSRDRRKDCEQIVIGVVTSSEGYPIKHYVFTGNTIDSTTVQQVIKDLKTEYNIGETVFVGDRGMITHLNLKQIEKHGFNYIMGVKLHQDQVCQLLFENDRIKWDDTYGDLNLCEKNIAVKQFLREKTRDILSKEQINYSSDAFAVFVDMIEDLTNTDSVDYHQMKGTIYSLSSQINYDICKKIFKLIEKYEGQYEKQLRFIFCQNPDRKAIAYRQRDRRITLISNDLDDIFSKKDEKIEVEITKLFSEHRKKYKKYFEFEYTDEKITGYSLNRDRLMREQQMDGVFVLCTDTEYSALSPAEIVDSYKNLQEVEILHDDLKNFVDVRPIRHWLDDRVRAHVFICLLALLLKRIFEIDCLGNKSVTSPLAEISKVKLVTYQIRKAGQSGQYETIPQTTRINPIQKKYFKKVGIKNPSKLENFMW